MARFEVTGPDGTRYQVEGPDGTTEQDAIAQAQKHIAAQPAPPPGPDLAATADVPGQAQGTPAEISGRVAQTGSAWQPAINTVGRVGQAAAEGWRSGTMQTPEARAENEKTLLGHFLINPLVEAGNLPFRAMGAVGAGAGQAAYEGGAAIGGPALGRDLFMLNQLAPALMMPGSMHPGLPEAPKPGPRFIGEYPGGGVALPGTTSLDRLTGAVRRVDDTAPPRPIPSASEPGVAPERGSVGAAASVNPPPMTPAEALASRSTGEQQRLMTTPQPGDAREYVPGVKPTKAEIELAPSVSRESKGLRQEFREGFTDKEKADNDLYHDFYDRRAGTPTIVERMDRERAAQAEKDLAETWRNKRDADASPLLDVANQIKASPDGRRPVVRNAIDSVVKELYDANGNLLTDPEQLYGVRKHLGDLLSKEAARDNPMAVRATANLKQLQRTLDVVIEDAAPGFGQYLRNFSEASKPIDVMERLQKAKAGLTNGADRVITFGKFDRLMKDLVAERADPDMTLAAKHIPDEVMGELFDMHRSLARSASDQELAKTRGSDTSQMLGELGRQGIAQGIAAIVPIPGASLAAPFVTRQFGGMLTKRRLEKHLNPDVTPYKNSLGP